MIDIRLDGAARQARDAHPTFEGRPFHDPDEPLFDQGLAFDIETLLSRRSILKVIGLGGVSAGLLAACGPGAAATTSPAAASASGATAGSTAAAAADCTVIPEETAGPFPGDGSNGPDVLTQSGVVRSDITTSFGASTTKAEGVPLTIRFAHPRRREELRATGQRRGLRLALRPRRELLAVLAGRHERELPARRPGGRRRRDRDLHQHLPGLLPGRWPHVHFEVYPSLDRATDPANRIATSQIALPGGHLQGGLRDRRLREQPDHVRRRSHSPATWSSATTAAIHQIGAMSGTIDSGLTVELPVPVQTA